MAKLVRRNHFLSRQKKWEHFKMIFRHKTYKLSIFANIYMGLHIYNPKITVELTTIFRDIYLKVAPIMESLINQLPL